MKMAPAAAALPVQAIFCHLSSIFDFILSQEDASLFRIAHETFSIVRYVLCREDDSLHLAVHEEERMNGSVVAHDQHIVTIMLEPRPRKLEDWEILFKHQ
jgi:hypothetical protein